MTRAERIEAAKALGGRFKSGRWQPGDPEMMLWVGEVVGLLDALALPKEEADLCGSEADDEAHYHAAAEYRRGRLAGIEEAAKWVESQVTAQHFTAQLRYTIAQGIRFALATPRSTKEEP